MTKKASLILPLLLLFSSSLYAAELYISGKKQNITIDAFTYDGNRLDITPKSTSSGGSSGSGGGGSGGGVAGNDPGTGLWKPNATTFVHDPGNGIEIQVPRCVPSQYNNCRYGTRSTYDTVKAGQIWSMRVNHNIKPGAAHYIKVARAETGESLTAFDVSLSTTPGDFNVSNPHCVRVMQGKASSLSVYRSDNDNGRRCVMEPGVRYYFNVRPAVGTPGETQCGNSSANACRYRILWNLALN